jgi:chemotaxis protein MotB
VGIDPSRLSAAGYGEFKPRAPNHDEAARAQNRRVDLVILNAATQLAEEPEPAR